MYIYIGPILCKFLLGLRVKCYDYYIIYIEYFATQANAIFLGCYLHGNMKLS